MALFTIATSSRRICFGSGYRHLVQSWGLDPALAERLVANFWESYDLHCDLAEDVRVTLRALRRRQLKLGVVTNGSSLRQRRKIAALGLETSFDAILVSEEEGLRKPVADVDGAHRAGLIAVWKYVPYWPPVVAAAPVIRELSEVLALVERR
jgi:putative hydrolase of the HAD superfamily